MRRAGSTAARPHAAADLAAGKLAQGLWSAAHVRFADLLGVLWRSAGTGTCGDAAVNWYCSASSGSPRCSTLCCAGAGAHPLTLAAAAYMHSVRRVSEQMHSAQRPASFAPCSMDQHRWVKGAHATQCCLCRASAAGQTLIAAVGVHQRAPRLALLLPSASWPLPRMRPYSNAYT